MSFNADTMYRLLPAVLRTRDAEGGEPLRGLVEVLAAQAGHLEENIAQLYENWFIETCEEWVVPYIGDLVGNRALNTVAHSRRADVARTIYYRRRKATLPMLEELARDVTGWGAHCVEFFELLGWTQNLNHLRMAQTPDPLAHDPVAFDRVGTVNLRNLDAVDRIGRAFDRAAHTVDVRRIANDEGWYNIRNIGFFLWRLGAYPVLRAAPRQAAAPDGHGFFLSPLGNDIPLFTRPLPEVDPRRVAEEHHVPGPIRPLAFSTAMGNYHGEDRSLEIFVAGVPVPLANIRCMDLSTWSRPPAGFVGVDVRRGRISFATGEEPATPGDLAASYTYGFSAPIGGGPYDRRASMLDDDLATLVLRVREDGVSAPGEPAVTHTSVVDAITAWETAAPEARPNTIIRILDSRSYALPVTIALANERWLAIEAADGERPHLQTDATGLEVAVLAPEDPTNTDRQGALRLSGLLVEGFVRVTGDLGGLEIVHTTLVPGCALGADGTPATTEPSLVVAAEDGATERFNDQLELELTASITGPLRLPEHVASLRITDGIVDGLGATAIGSAADAEGPHAIVERSTFFGAVRLRSVEASESIFDDVLRVVRTQEGCVRFSYLTPGSRAPRRYRCQPDLAAQAAVDAAAARDPLLDDAARAAIRAAVGERLRPSFATREYGRPEYAQLRARSPVEIGTGAEDGSEMGAFCSQRGPLREANLRIRLEEYLPVGLEPGIIWVT